MSKHFASPRFAPPRKGGINICKIKMNSNFISKKIFELCSIALFFFFNQKKESNFVDFFWLPFFLFCHPQNESLSFPRCWRLIWFVATKNIFDYLFYPFWGAPCGFPIRSKIDKNWKYLHVRLEPSPNKLCGSHFFRAPLFFPKLFITAIFKFV